MTDTRKMAEHTSERVRELVSEVMLKHERAVLEVMLEQRAEIERLRAERDAANAPLLAEIEARARYFETFLPANDGFFSGLREEIDVIRARGRL